jgi:nicotinamide mononucleotide transporter
MSLLEILAVLLGIANILLIIKRSVWNFPVAIIMVLLYFVIFRDAKLYSDAGLQIFFAAVNSAMGYGLWILGAIAAIWAWGAVMHSETDAAYPYWDASVAMLSIAGQILMARRFVENWHFWIIVNLISIPLYAMKELYLTAGLYGLFLVLSVAGLIAWRKAEQK